MSWENSEATKAKDQTAEQKPDVKAEPPQGEVKAGSDGNTVKTDDGKAAADASAESKSTQSGTKADDATASQSPADSQDETQKRIGRIAKAVREKAKESYATRIKELEEENRKLRESGDVNNDLPTVIQDDAEQVKIEVRRQFLLQQERLGKIKHGQAYDDALTLVASQKDPQLLTRIQWADDPVEALMNEAQRIADEQEFGPDPKVREAKKEAMIEERVRKKVEAEMQAKFAAAGKQPTDMQRHRAASGDTQQGTIASWNTTLPD